MKSIFARTWEIHALQQGRKMDWRRPVPDSKEEPPYEMGDILHVKEAYAFETCPLCGVGEHDGWGAGPCSCGILYRADCGDGRGIKWRPSTTMSPSFSRFSLRVVRVRLERVMDSTSAEAFREGALCYYNGLNRWGLPLPNFSVLFPNPGWENCVGSARHAIGQQWNKDYPKLEWESNPWSWVYEMERV